MVADPRVYGPYLRKDGRKHVILIYATGRRRTVSYPRWVLEQQGGAVIPVGIDVHHKNDDHINDSLENLELKSHVEHCREHSTYPSTMISIICVLCKKVALKKAKDVRWNQCSNDRVGPFCGKSCSGKWSRIEQIKNGLSNTRCDTYASVTQRPR